jgi:Aspartyl protease
LKIRVINIAILLTFSGCSSEQQPNQIIVPYIQDSTGRIAIDLIANDGKTMRALVDSGTSTFFFLKPELAKRLNLTFVPLITRQINGVTGVGSKARFAFLKITRMGDTLGDWDVFPGVGDAYIGQHEALMGMGFLNLFDVDFDLKRKQLRLLRKGTQRREQGSVSFKNCDASKPQFSLSGVCGRDVIYVDTGARRTAANPDMLQLLAKSIHLGKGLEAEPIKGVNGRTLPAQSYAINSNIAGLRVRHLVVANFRGRGGCKFPCAELILGMDTLGSLDRLKITENWISFK